MNMIINQRTLVQNLEELLHEIEAKLEKSDCPLLSAVLMREYEETMKKINELNTEMCEIACSL